MIPIVLRCVAIATMFFGVCCADDSIKLTDLLDSTVPTETEYQIRIAGQIITPSPEGPQKFALNSAGQFIYQQQIIAGEQSGPLALRAVRNFSRAMTSTTVDRDHVTKVGLSSAYRTIYVVGSEDGLTCYSPKYLIPRQQLDLIQMSFDPLAVDTLLPTGSVTVGEKWNTPDWLMPVLTGIETAVERSTSCTLKSLDSETAVIQFSGKISGAVRGSAANIAYSGEFTVDREQRLITSFVGQQKEKRTPGPVSPGLDVTADVRWTTKRSSDAITETPDVPSDVPEEKLQLILQTPLRLQIQHSREWHLFHETPSMLMMRQLRNGQLISQCNIAPAITVAPGQHLPDREYLGDVEETLKKLNGKVIQEATIRDDSLWRIRHVQAEGDNSGDSIVWDHYLCTANSGEQFSVVFSHSKADEKLFNDEANRILTTLQLARKRPALPFP